MLNRQGQGHRDTHGYFRWVQLPRPPRPGAPRPPYPMPPPRPQQPHGHVSTLQDPNIGTNTASTDVFSTSVLEASQMQLPASTVISRDEAATHTTVTGTDSQGADTADKPQSSDLSIELTREIITTGYLPIETSATTAMRIPSEVSVTKLVRWLVHVMC